MGKDALSPGQKMALAYEVDAVVRLMKEGIAALRRLDGSSDFVHLPMQLLAQGLERLLKLTLALAELKDSGALPDPKTLKSTYGHDILALVDAVVGLVEGQDEYVCRPAVQEDLSFLRDDSHLRSVLAALSTFGTWSRYYRLQEFLAPEDVDPKDDPDRAWKRIEMELLQAHPDWMEQLEPGRQGRAAETIARDLTATLERFGRAITRMWTLGALHAEAGRHVGVIRGLLFLRDQDLGHGRA
jgi:hypothetical protein